MAYAVNLTARAQRDLASFYGEINAQESEKAWTRHRGLRVAILSLEETPNRCPFTRERATLRHLLYGHKPHVYRVIFRVLEKQKRVDVLHIRHAAHRDYTESDLA